MNELGIKIPHKMYKRTYF